MIAPVPVHCFSISFVKIFKYTVFSISSFARFIGSLMRLKNPRPLYGPTSFLCMLSLLLKDLNFSLSFIQENVIMMDSVEILQPVTWHLVYTVHLIIE